MNERDVLKHRLFFDKSYKEVEIKELENELNRTREEWTREQRMSREKLARLEEVSKTHVPSYKKLKKFFFSLIRFYQENSSLSLPGVCVFFFFFN